MEPVGIFMGICIDGFGHLQTSETSGRNMTVRVRQPASAPSKNRMGGNEDLNDFKGEQMKNLLIQMLSMLV
jgi:hypothetical protein